MENDSIDPQGQIEVDYSQYDEAVQKLKPKVYQQDDVFCCLSGPDKETGIFGSGDTLDAAIQAWKSALEERFKRLHGEDER